MTTRRSIGVGLPALLCLTLALAGRAQQPPAPGTTNYRPPVLVLALPPSGATVPADKPVVVFRFSPGEALDPLDLRSFAIAVDGSDRTPLFRVSPDEAWGALSDADQPIATGAHSVSARICSMRGACALAQATITVTPAPAAADNATESTKPRSNKQRFLDALLSAARKLLIP